MASDSIQEQLAVLRMKAALNPQSFIQSNLWIQDKDGKRVLMRPTWSQQQLENKIREIEEANNPVRLIGVKGRQVGFSSWELARMYTRVRGRSGRHGLIVAQLEETVVKLFKKIKYFEENLDERWKIPLKHLSTEKLEYQSPFSSSIELATAGSNSAGRSITVQDAHLTEAAFYPQGLRKFKGALEPAIPYKPGTSIVIESTGNGVGDDFHEEYKAAKAGESPYKHLFIPWQKDPALEHPFENDREMHLYLERAFGQFPQLYERMKHFGLTGEKIAFYYDMLISLNRDELLCQQEFPCTEDEAFIASGATIFSIPLLDHYKLRTKPGIKFDPYRYENIQEAEHDPHIRKGIDPYFEVWSKPRADRTYWISADSAGASDESDHSCVYVFDLITQNLCAKLYGRINPTPLAHLIKKLGMWYNYAQAVPEVDGTGVALLEALKQIYFNIYMQRKIEGFKTVPQPNKLGWETNPTSRALLIRLARQILGERKETASYFIPDEDLVSELLTFVNRDGKAQAAAGCRDDMVMAWLIGLYTCFHGLDLDPSQLPSKSSDVKPQDMVRPATAEEVIAMVRDPRWYGQPIDMKSVYETPFHYGEDY